MFRLCSRASAITNLIKRYHSTDVVSTTISNNNGRLRLDEEKYCNDFSTPITKPFENILKSLENETIEKFSKSFMMVSETQGKFLHQLVKLLQPENVLEIGGFTGYSAIAMASALPPESSLVSLELNVQHAGVSMKYIEESGLQEIVNIIVGPAEQR